jgi:hypothetical protein
VPRPPALLVLVGCALALTGCSSKPTPSGGRDDTEAKAVAFVEKLKGKVVRDDKRPGKPVVLVNLNFTTATDAELKELAPFNHLTALYLGGTQVTDAGLKELGGFYNLTKLDLDCTKVTDPGLKELAGLKRLQWLHLGGTWVTDAGMKELTALKKLKWLNVRFTLVTDTGLEEIWRVLPDCEIVR